ncbi:tRNA-specific 2-thiouridylase MnmA [Muribaculaceae bacterium]|jgi:tRNA-specific 2-thiouridylase|uniref:tRNA 2-thiouridine(34) synthase MnmA n=1 Tax=Paramuribaculum intestinale TaxID=2094151 RepID=UPI000AD78DD6|nr:tRNA 2-thiouridine(34) synthase MnmA [Paramuribaculum intestinale]MCX4293958.1 tRNA 2-thiouridine(34) synthase MnmA [Prevotella sp.]GFI05311.1 tRNA-specific 2-thiouridylase MnmA [Muribaculaceae bacterium]
MKIAALISGGVDSAVAVHRLVEQGHDIHLFYIRIGLDNGEGDCSAEEDIEMCQFIAAKYGLPFDVVSLHEEYWESVMEYALKTVREGLTPNPDIMCNRLIKFGYFEQRWGHEFDKTATGHYASTIIGSDGLVYLATAPDPVKDQTDFLARITYSQLSHIMFPIGDMPKSRVRELAIQATLPNAYRRDSQGICFLGKINYNDFIRRHLGEKPGPIVELETGRKLGEHRGFWFHTIGQRKGLGLSGGPWYVVKKNIHDNVVYVSQGYDTEKQYGRTLHLDEMHWITRDPELSEISFKNRHTPEFTPASLIRLSEREYVIQSENKIQGIAPGQFAVIYDRQGHICYGSGIITGQQINI